MVRIFLFLMSLVLISCTTTKTIHEDVKYVEAKDIFNKTFFKVESKSMRMAWKKSYEIAYRYLPVKVLPQKIIINKSWDDPRIASSLFNFRMSIINELNEVVFSDNYRIPIFRGSNNNKMVYSLYKKKDRPEAMTNFKVRIDITNGSGYGLDRFFLYSYAREKEKLY